jgi:hypothetical protein
MLLRAGCLYSEEKRERDGWSKPVPGWIIVRESGEQKTGEGNE